MISFDRVWHNGLIFKFKQQKVRGPLLNWISNYLGNREQRVFVGQLYSDVKHVKAGVPQGSVLGPLLFLVYVNAITQNILSTARLFPDDTALAYTTSNIDDLQSIINHDLREISKWSKQWLVTSNPDKTEVLYFGICQPPLLEFNNTILSITFDHENGVGMQGTMDTGLRILCIPDQRQQFVMKLIGPGCTCHPFL